jgi:hypothetical protein
VTKGPIRDVAASVRQRLLNRARATSRPLEARGHGFAGSTSVTGRVLKSPALNVSSRVMP